MSKIAALEQSAIGALGAGADIWANTPVTLTGVSRSGCCGVSAL